jgi:hypothetical protein
VLNCCEELPGVWSWEENDIPFPIIIEYLKSFENNKSKNLKLAYIASNFHQYCTAYGLNVDRKQVVKKLYENKCPINNQEDLDMALQHIVVFINDEYYVEEAIFSEYGSRYKLRYYNSTQNGLGKPLTEEELKKPDFIDEEGRLFEAKMCWEAKASKFKSDANLYYEIDPNNFNEKDFLAAFNKLPQAKAMHKAPWCFCLVKKKATFGYLIGVGIQKQNGINCGISAKLIGPLNVQYFKANPKFI